MKKFLSLVLALVMTMSLVTIGAGATEYKDFSDKSEVQYAEAVAVLNKIGIITGYEDGSFRPTGALTRGAAAKIIVSLMIGSEAAANLTATAAPYSDVPVTNTFAGVIAYCKTAGYISGYADGTFRPTGALTGYAFSKMLLGALGYDGKVEGFTGSGWTMNVAKIGNKAGLFNRLDFVGNNGVNREQACQLALNTLKATEVEYVGNSVNVTGKDINVSVGNNKYGFVENQSTTDGKIKDDGLMQFAEEHFKDLKLTDGAVTGTFGRPSNQWTYKSVKIGDYAKTADYTYTTACSGDTQADKQKDMGINSMTLAAGAQIYTNGANFDLTTLKQITDATANGALVEIYLTDTANEIGTVVVVNTYIAQVKKVTSSGVTLKAPNDAKYAAGFNEVKSGDDCYKALSALKADDYVLVTVDSKDVQSVTVPQSVSGVLSTVKLNTAGTAVKGVTVAGTAYSMSAKWDSKDGNLTTSTTPDSKSNTTVYLDEYGYAIYVTDVTSSSSYMVFKEWNQTLINGKLVYMANGYDMDGKEISLNMGTNVTAADFDPSTGVAGGDVLEYEPTTLNNADYAWGAGSSITAVAKNASGNIAAGQAKIGTDYFASDVKFIYVSSDANGVTGVTVKTGVQKVDNTKAGYSYIVDDNSIEYVVVANDDDLDIGTTVMYVYKASTTTLNDKGERVSVFSAYDQDGTKLADKVADTSSVTAGKFYKYSEADGVYKLREYVNYGASGKTTSVMVSKEYAITMSDADAAAKKATMTAGGKDFLVEDFRLVSQADLLKNDAGDALTVNFKTANFIDETGAGTNFTSLEDILTAVNPDDNTKAIATVTMAFVFNGNSDSSGCGKVAQVIITGVTFEA